MYQRKKDIFSQPTIEAARQVILTNYEGHTTDERWNLETPEEVTALRRLIPYRATVCDFGIGIGRISKPLFEEMPEIKIKGIDASDTMLDYCREYVPADLQKRLELFRYNDINRVETNSIDFAFAIYVLQHIPADQFDATVLQLKRIIKPGGSLYLLNTDTFRAVPWGRPTWFNDRYPQWEAIDEHFEERMNVGYQSEYMKKMLKTHRSKLFRPRK